MRKILILIISALSFIQLYAQVGINTNNVHGILHIDAKANNPATGTIPVASLTDDVIVDENGNIGAGMSVITPKAKVDISSGTKWKALRLVDGNEGLGMVLFGDANGYAHWGMLKGSGGYKLQITGPATALPLSTDTRVTFNSGTNYLPITAAADYIVMVRITYTYNAAPTLNRISIYHRLYKNTQTVPEEFVEVYADVIGGKKISAYILLKGTGMQINDMLQLAVNPGGSNLSIDTTNSYIIFYRV